MRLSGTLNKNCSIEQAGQAKRLKVLVFHPFIAPYRVRFFNDIYDTFDTIICLYYRNLQDNKFDMDLLAGKFHFRPVYLDRFVRIAGRKYHFGHLHYLKKADPDLVITTEYGEALWLALVYRWVHKKKYAIVTICDDSPEMAKSRRSLRRAARDIGAKKADGIILCNDETAEYYKQYQSNIFTFPIIQDEEEFHQNDKEAMRIAGEIAEENQMYGHRIFLFVGRFLPEKNLPFLIKSFIHAHHKYPENLLFIIGGDSYKDYGLRDKLREIIRDGNAEGYIKMVGRREGLELKAWYYAGQILILPSFYEPFGAVVNEALLAGEYVMVSDVAGAACLVNASNGETFDIRKEYIDFSRVSEKIGIMYHIVLRESRMTVSYQDLANGLIGWLRNIVLTRKR